MIILTLAVLSVLYACVLYFCICTCSAQLSMFHMERRSRNTLIIIIKIMIIIMIIIIIVFFSFFLTHRSLCCDERRDPRVSAFCGHNSKSVLSVVVYAPGGAGIARW